MRSIINKKGNLMFNLMFFFMGLAVLFIFINPIGDIMELMEQSDTLNCQGYIYNGDANHTLSYNSSLNTNSLACISIKLYLPFILLAFLFGGVAVILGNKASDTFGVADTAGGY